MPALTSRQICSWLLLSLLTCHSLSPWVFWLFPFQFSPSFPWWGREQVAVWAWLLAGLKPQHKFNFLSSVFAPLHTRSGALLPILLVNSSYTEVMLFLKISPLEAHLKDPWERTVRKEMQLTIRNLENPLIKQSCFKMPDWVYPGAEAVGNNHVSSAASKCVWVFAKFYFCWHFEMRQISALC